MILIKILEHDLHRSKTTEAAPLMQEVPAQPSFVPAVISNSRGRFIVSRKLTEGNLLRVGVFQHDPDYLDNVMNDMFNVALSLSKEEGWPNIFSGKKRAEKAFDYIKESTDEMLGQPHVVLVPDSWSPAKVSKFFGKENLDENRRKYKEYCRIQVSPVPCVVFCSRPDMVGMYTQFLGGNSSVLLHNVKLGIAFCV